MDTMKRPLLLVFVLGVVAGAAYYVMTRNAWQPPLAVKIQSEVEVTAMMPTWILWQAVGEAGQPKGLLLRDGDYLFRDGFPMRYRASDGQSIVVTATPNGSAKIGDKVVTVLVEKENTEDGSGWLKTATDQQLADIRTLGVGKEVDAEALASLKRLAAVNPTVDLFVGSGGGFRQVMPLFKPRAVLGLEGMDAGDRQALANQPQIEMLMIEAADPGSLDLLPALPALRTLLIGKWDAAAAGSLPSLPNLKSLQVMETELTDLKPLGAVAAGLEELSLTVDHLKDVSGIEKMTHLRTLVLWSEEEIDLSGLSGLKDLRWAGLPSKTSQQQFAAFVGAHPKLVILDMTKNESVKDLSPLGTLKDLQGIVLDGPYDNLNAIQTLKSLRFVGVSEDVWDKMPEQVAAVQKALPDALVVKVKPYCLGSGWILLVVPVPFVAWWIRRRRSARVEHAA